MSPEERRSFNSRNNSRGNSRFGDRNKRRFGDRDNRRDNRRFGNRDNGRRFGDRRNNFSRGPREMHKAKCTKCGKECEVPFKPTEGRHVYCDECFKEKRR